MRNWFEETFMTNAKCSKCGNDDKRVMEFHHRDPNAKDGAVKRMVFDLKSKASIELEVAKCDMLCANCHRIAHWELNQQ